MSQFHSRSAWRDAREAYVRQFMEAADPFVVNSGAPSCPDWVRSPVTLAAWVALPPKVRAAQAVRVARRVFEAEVPKPAPAQDPARQLAAVRREDPARAEAVAVAQAVAQAEAVPAGVSAVVACAGGCGRLLPARSTYRTAVMFCGGRAARPPRREPLEIAGASSPSASGRAVRRVKKPRRVAPKCVSV